MHTKQRMKIIKSITNKWHFEDKILIWMWNISYYHSTMIENFGIYISEMPRNILHWIHLTGLFPEWLQMAWAGLSSFEFLFQWMLISTSKFKICNLCNNVYFPPAGGKGAFRHYNYLWNVYLCLWSILPLSFPESF